MPTESGAAIVNMKIKPNPRHDAVRCEMMKSNRTRLEDYFLRSIQVLGLPEPVREFVFAKPRRWRFDFAYPDRKLAIEIEGGTWIHGGHVRGKIYRDNCRKYNAAVLQGWRVLRFTTDMVKSWEAAGVTKLEISPSAGGAEEDHGMAFPKIKHPEWLSYSNPGKVIL